LGGLEPEKISALADIPLPQLSLWESLFFDVWSRLTATSWIVQHVIQAEIDAGDWRLAERLRLALAGGKKIAELLLRDEVGTAIEPADRIQLLQMRLDLRLRQALLIPIVTPTQVGKLVDQVVRIQQMHEEYELQKQRLASQERQAERLDQAGMLRLQILLATVSSQVHDVGVSDDGAAEPQVFVFPGGDETADEATGMAGNTHSAELPPGDSYDTRVFVAAPPLATFADTQQHADHEDLVLQARCA
jgi:hypothetical protein